MLLCKHEGMAQVTLRRDAGVPSWRLTQAQRYRSAQSLRRRRSASFVAELRLLLHGRLVEAGPGSSLNLHLRF